MKSIRPHIISAIITAGLTLTSCTTLETTGKKPELRLVKSSFKDLPGWSGGSAQSLAAFTKSCERILKSDPAKPFGNIGTYGDWQTPCRNLPTAEKSTAEQTAIFFETYFSPYKASDKNGPKNGEGLFTGYYEPSLRGSPVQSGPYQTPLRQRPQDLVMVNLGDFRDELKGQRIAGRVKDGYLKPYEDRAQIEEGKLPKSVDKPLYWVDSAVEAFFLQVQGSGVVTLPDGRAQRIGYDGQNGHPYYAIGKELIKRGELTKDNVSMQSIKSWLAAHPTEATEIMRSNPSYVFFKKLDTEGPLGAEGLVLTPESSMAVDHTIWPYGTPLFVAAKNPDSGQTDLERLMIAQDTGGAILGVVRGDFFWGYGEEASRKAGIMKSSGEIWALIPKTAQIPDSQ